MDSDQMNLITIPITDRTMNIIVTTNISHLNRYIFCMRSKRRTLTFLLEYVGASYCDVVARRILVNICQAFVNSFSSAAVFIFLFNCSHASLFIINSTFVFQHLLMYLYKRGFSCQLAFYLNASRLKRGDIYSVFVLDFSF